MDGVYSAISLAESRARRAAGIGVHPCAFDDCDGMCTQPANTIYCDPCEYRVNRMLDAAIRSE